MSNPPKRYPLIANNLAAVRICCGILARKQTADHAIATQQLERIGAALDVMTATLRETEDLGLIMDEELVSAALRHSDRILSHGLRSAGQGPGPDLGGGVVTDERMAAVAALIEGHGWLVVSGDPVKGLVFYGLFPSNEAACDWAQTALTGGEDWWVAPLLCSSTDPV